MASTFGFEIFDQKSGDLLCYKELAFGAENFTEIEENLVAVCEYGGNAKLFKIQQ